MYAVLLHIININIFYMTKIFLFLKIIIKFRIKFF